MAKNGMSKREFDKAVLTLIKRYSNEGKRIPSQGEIAETLNSNEMRVSRAYGRLEEEGKIKRDRFPNGKIKPLSLRIIEDIQYDIFLSYSRKDKGFAFFIKEQLEESGLNVWIDLSKIVSGRKWKQEINNGLSISEIILVIISPHSIKSKNVKYEWQYALENNKSLLPLYFYEVEALPPELSHYDYVDFRDEFRLQKLFDSIADSLGHIVERK